MGGEQQLVERSEDLEKAAAALERARDGEGRLMLVEGPAGIGKSSLLRAVAERARAAGMMALTARGGELERTFAFGLVRELFERPLVRDAELRARVLSGAARLAAAIVAPDADGGPAPDSPGAAHHALYWLTANLSERQPVLLILDDLQWADAGSLGWVLHLTRRLGDLQVAVAAAWRTGEPGCDEVSAGYLRDEPHTDILRPAALSEAAVAQIVRDVLPEAGWDLCLACHRRSGGNPFLLRELLRSLRDTGAHSGADVEHAQPQSVARAIARRLRAVGESADQLAEAVAVLGDAVELRAAAALAGLEQPEAVAAADQLAAAGILTAERPLRFEHPLVRSAVYGAIPP